MNHLRIDSWPLPVTEFEKSNYSRRQIVDAGKLLSQSIPASNHNTTEVLDAFRVAHNWRRSYALPMHRVRHQLRGKVGRESGTGLTAARLKRMQSIRAKLAPGKPSLYQMQDIAGARAILPAISDIDRVTGYFTDGDSPHGVVRIDDYVSKPKDDGYRSRHIILKFNGTGEDQAYNRQFVEVQLRTKMQHSWATAVEAVGLVRGENLKSGSGDATWLRFFELMSAKIAEREGCPPPPTTPPNPLECQIELAQVAAELGAIAELESYNQAIQHTSSIRAAGIRFFLIEYFPSERRVEVSPYHQFQEGGRAYDSISGESNAVLVEVDRVRDLKIAYPNYFLDVQDFVSEVRIALGTGARTRHSTIDDLDTSWVSSWRTNKGRTRD